MLTQVLHIYPKKTTSDPIAQFLITPANRSGLMELPVAALILAPLMVAVRALDFVLYNLTCKSFNKDLQEHWGRPRSLYYLE
jgi:hypothetical protein